MKLRRGYLTIALVYLFGLTSAFADDLLLRTVLDNTAITPPARANFREIRHNNMLKDELVITGYLEYLEEGVLRKVIEAPFQESYLIDDGWIQIERDGVTKAMSLKKSRSLRTMLRGIEAILAGETTYLTRVFDSELSGSETDWSLRLQPRSRRISRQLHALTVTGDAESIAAIRFDLRDGEYHQMEIVALRPSQ